MSEKLWCTRCHTVWDEACLHEWEACLFKDCDGTLSRTAPVAIERPARTPKQPPTYPLFEHASDE